MLTLLNLRHSTLKGFFLKSLYILFSSLIDSNIRSNYHVLRYIILSSHYAIKHAYLLCQKASNQIKLNVCLSKMDIDIIWWYVKYITATHESWLWLCSNIK